MVWVNYQAIKERVNMEQVLEHYGVLSALRAKGDELVGCCPIHKGTNSNQFHASRTKNIFHCFGNCQAGGDVIDFVVNMEGGNKKHGGDVRAAALKIQDWFGLTFERPTGGRHRNGASMPATAAASVSTTAEDAGASRTRIASTDASSGEPADEQPASSQARESIAAPHQSTAVISAPAPEQTTVNPPLKFALKSLDPDHAYLKERGFSADTIATFGVGMCTGKGIMAGRVAIPIHNEQGELVAYAGRWPGDPPDGEGKYKLPVGFHKSQVVYNLHRIKELAKDKGLIVVEGFFDCMQLHQSGITNVVALMGSSMSDEQEALIVAAVGPQGKVALMFDEDDAGWKGREDALSRLASRVHVKVIGLGEEGTQPDSLSAEDLARCLGGI